MDHRRGACGRADPLVRRVRRRDSNDSKTGRYAAMMSNDAIDAMRQEQLSKVAGAVGGRDPRREADYAAATEMERRGELAKRAPGAAACWSAIDSVGHCVAVDPATLQAATEPLTTPE